MATFAYSARDSSGKILQGKIEASSKELARGKLDRRRLKVLALKAYGSGEQGDDESTPILGSFIVRDAKGDIQISFAKQKPSSKDRIIFTKQFSTMLNSGVPLIQALQILTQQQENRGFRKNLRQISQAVENGSSLSQALRALPEIFDTLYVSMTEAGEVSGQLDVILLKLVGFLEKSDKIKSQVKSAMSYPLIIVFVAMSVVAGLLSFVVPVFAAQFAESDRKLPAITQFVVDSSDQFSKNWWIFALGLTLLVFAVRAGLKTPRGAFYFDKCILKSPVLGILLQKVAIGRFCSTLSIMLVSGVNLLSALSICATSSGNKVLEQFIMGVRSSLEKGSNLSTPLSEGKLFPKMVTAMIAVGEATGNLDSMLNKVSEFYDEEVDIAVKGLLSMIEPIMIVLIGGIVGFIVIAMYLPIFEMAG